MLRYILWSSSNANIIYYKLNNNKEIIKIKDFSLRIDHNIPYEQYIYFIYNDIVKDYKNNIIDIEKLKTNFIYARACFMNIINQLPYTQLNKLELDFINKYKIKEINSRFNNEKYFHKIYNIISIIIN